MNRQPCLAAALGTLLFVAAPNAHAEKHGKKHMEPKKATADAAGTTTTTAANPLAPTEQGTERQPNRLLLIGGATVFGVTYVSSVLVGITSDRDSDKNLFIPIAGPWIALGSRDCDVDACNAKVVTGALLVADGLLQTAGAFTVAAAFFIPERATPFTLGSAGNRIAVVPA